ncbi:zinc finger protein 11-like [Pempheris klunzingeri]|uniref:zinc finger protein 11-like n=1 Tax=Pempheris klunzingeri TaxID=3127111 RepID=UPI00397EA346
MTAKRPTTAQLKLIQTLGCTRTAGEASFQPPRCSETSVEGGKKHLDVSRDKEPSEESTIRSLTRSRADVSESSRGPGANTCLECGKTFASRSSLKKHHVVHSSVRPFKCTQCDNSYKSQKYLNQHFLIHSKPKALSFACSLCEKRFSAQALLTVHLRRHSGERPFACSYCDKRFLTNAVLKSHVRIHTGERPYACTFCDKKFTQLYPRTVHLRMHKKEKPYLCSTCGMSFCSSGALLVHSRTHTGERPYQCESCGKGFATAVQLTVHRRFHTGERPYSCSQCDKSFHCSSGLKKHTRTHTGEKPHQCLTCHKTFSQKSNMKIHLKVAQERNVEQYDKLAEFITVVTEMVPELLSYKQKTQLILGLRARIILEFLTKIDPIDSNGIQEHLNIFQNMTMNCKEEEDQDGEVEISKSAFVELVQTLLSDKYEKDTFLKEMFPALYGSRFDTVLQILVWEFFYRLEEFLPVPSFSKVSSVFDLSSFDFQFEQFVSDHDDLRKILQHQKQRQKLTKSEYSFMSDTILSTLASKQTLVASEDHTDSIRDGKDGHSSDEETDNSSIKPDPSNSQFQENHVSSWVPQSAYYSLPVVYETQVTISEEAVADSTRVQESNRAAELKLNLSSTAEETGNLTCLQCRKRFRTPVMLRRHLRAEHPSLKQLHRCDKCEKTFQTKRRLEQHFQAHSDVKPYVCSYCGKGLPCPKVLETHLRLHTGKRPYACKYCDKKFDQPYSLTQHIRLHKGEKPYLCSECGRAFSNRGAFQIHSRLHTGERPYHCKDCGKKYITLQRLKVHQRIHTGERPFPCSQCGKFFRCQSGLAKHIRIHTGERPYKCVACDKRFYSSNNLKIHLRSHKETRQAKASTE